MLIFLFISCGGGSKTPVDDDSAAVVPDEDEKNCEENDVDDVEDTEQTEDDDSFDEDVTESSLPDEQPENNTVTIFNGAVCTGQTKCYDMEKEIPCPKEGKPFYGQDAQYAKLGKCLPKNYTVKKYDDGETVVDNNTGLEWDRQSFSAKGNHNQIMYDYCGKRKEIGGYWDWRTPAMEELFLIVDGGTFEPAVDTVYFPDTPSKFFFSGEFYHEALGNHSENVYNLGVDFKDGSYSDIQITNYVPEDYNNIRCVRGKVRRRSSCNTYLFSGEGYEIYNDVQNRLVLQGGEYSGKNWEEALSYCENLIYAEISDWRLPNRNEALSLHKNCDDFWTSTTSASNPTFAWKTYSSDVLLIVDAVSKDTRLNVLCAASDPCGDGELWTGKKCASFAELFLKEDGCACQEGYGWNGSLCEKLCDNNLCKDIEHSTGLCLKKSSLGEPLCQCDEGFYWKNGKCNSPCEDNPCEEVEGADGICTVTDSEHYICGCLEGYYNLPGAGSSCVSIKSCGGNGLPCKNSSAKTLWAFPAERFMKWERAKQYCEDLKDFGYTDWRLPTIDELRIFETGCQKVKPDGECKASEKNSCLSAACLENCKCNDLSEEEFLRQYDFIWSSSIRSDNHNLVLGWNSGFIGSFSSVNSANVQGEVWCVRKID